MSTKTRHCVAGDHTVQVLDPDMSGGESGDGWVCNHCANGGVVHDEDDDD